MAQLKDYLNTMNNSGVFGAVPQSIGLAANSLSSLLAQPTLKYTPGTGSDPKFNQPTYTPPPFTPPVHPIDALARTQALLQNGTNTPDSNTTNTTTPNISTSTSNAPVQSKFSIDNFDPDQYFGAGGHTSDNLSTENLYAIRNAISGKQGDVLTKAITTGIPFSPEQLKGLHQSASDIYAPALADINARIEHAEKMDELNAAHPDGNGMDTSTTPVSDANMYTIQQGEDPYNIAQNNGLTIQTLKDLNPDITDWTKIQPGTQINLGSRNSLATRDIPSSIAPYYDISNNGTGYIDASKLQGTAADKKKIVDAATKSGVKVISNANDRADLSNIKNANLNLDDMAETFKALATTDPKDRDTYQALTNKLSNYLQIDPKQAAAGIYPDAALDILKAISGIQGFRGGTSIIQQVKDTFPKITDTQAVVQQKIDTMRQLISNREQGIVGNPKKGKSKTSNETDTILNEYGL